MLARFISAAALAFDATSGTLYGAENLTDKLLTINSTTGAASIVGG